MTKNNTYKSIILFILIFCLSIGYAVVNSVSLSITGNATSATKELDVQFTDTPTTSDSSKATATSSGHTATASVNNLTLNEKVTFTYSIENFESDVNANLEITIPESNEHFELTVRLVKASPEPISNEYELNNDLIQYEYLANTTTKTCIIPSGLKITLLVDVKLIKTPILEKDSKFDFTINITANPTTV